MLCKVLKELFEKFEQTKNPEIIILNAELQIVFNSFIIYIPKLFETLLPQLESVPDEIRKTLQRNNVFKNLTLYYPKNIIYQDSTSVFYLVHQINKCMKTNNFSFNWMELCSMWLDFCTTNQENFIRQGDIIQIKENSPMSTLLPFKYFHIDQCEHILKSITKYLGRKNFSTYICPYLNKKLFTDQNFNTILSFIEDKIDDFILPGFSDICKF